MISASFTFFKQNRRIITTKSFLIFFVLWRSSELPFTYDAETEFIRSHLHNFEAHFKAFLLCSEKFVHHSGHRSDTTFTELLKNRSTRLRLKDDLFSISFLFVFFKAFVEFKWRHKLSFQLERLGNQTCHSMELPPHCSLMIIEWRNKCNEVL